MKPEELRIQFPALTRSVYGNKLVYLDNAATSQRPLKVVEALSDASLYHNANIHRAVHCLASEATDLYEQARESVRAYINAPSKENVIFTSGATAAINLVAYSFAEAFIGEGDEVIVGESEHHSNLVPWQIVCARKGAKVIPLPVDEYGCLVVENLDSLITGRTRIVCVSHCSNVLGLVNPIEKIIETAHARGVKVLVDGAQGIVHCDVDVQKIGCDFYAFSGHKIYAATGTGVLYATKEMLDILPPFMGGGEMIGTVSWEGTTYADLPYKFEAGTPNFNASVTLKPAIGLLESIRKDEELTQSSELVKTFVYQRLISNSKIHLYGTADNLSQKIPVFSFTVDGAHHEDLALILDKMGIALRSGHMCAEPLMHRYGVTGMLRASFAPYNTMEEAEYFLACLDKAINMLV